MRKRFYYTLFEQFTTCLGALVITFVLAFVVSVTLEATFLNLEKFIFSPKPKSDSLSKKKPCSSLRIYITCNFKSCCVSSIKMCVIEIIEDRIGR